MPLDLITGLPGNGKTAFLVSELLRFEKEQLKRKIYICGLELLQELKLDIEVCSYEDIKNWTTFESGSLIIIDEAQNIFPQRGSSAKAPAYITDLSTHRHYGLDFILITQDPRLLDAWARRLIATHRHIKRLFGSQFQVVFNWDKVTDNPRERKDQSTATKKITRLPKQVYGVYQSSVEHTVKRNVPLAIYIVLSLFVIFPIAAYFALSHFELGGDGTKPDESPGPLDMISSAVSDGADSVLENELPPALRTKHPEYMIDFDLVLNDVIILGQYKAVTITMVNPANKQKTVLELSDLDDEYGLKYSLISQNKIRLSQNGKSKTLYRVRAPEIVQNFQPIPDNQNNGLKLPF